MKKSSLLFSTLIENEFLQVFMYNYGGLVINLKWKYDSGIVMVEVVWGLACLC